MTPDLKSDLQLSLRWLEVSFGTEAVLADVGFDLGRGEILGLVGQSGSGKSLTCRAMMGLLPREARVAGQLTLAGTSYDLADPRQVAPLRGANISMIFQDPMSALDPLMRVRGHLALRGHKEGAAEDWLRQAGIDDAARVMACYPHQLSGGLCQRVAIACALSARPRLLLADEPTTALDVTIQAEILGELRRIVRETGTSVIFVTHDVGVVAELCNRVLVMHQGRIVESGPSRRVLSRPDHSYTRQLLGALPRPQTRGQALLSVGMQAPPVLPPAPAVDRAGPPILRFERIGLRYPDGRGGSVDAVRDVTLNLWPGEILGLVGESGSGKSSLAKTAVGLAHPQKGRVLFEGAALGQTRADRRKIQYIFQDARGALDPTARVLHQLEEVLTVHRLEPKNARAGRASGELARAGLDAHLHRRRPPSLSGGQRQRATIARALLLQPKVLICDESVSALDVSIQARILNLLMELRAREGLSILFISHDLSVVHHLCDRIAVMQGGALVEEGMTEALWSAPRAPYTRRLLAAVPQLPAPMERELA